MMDSDVRSITAFVLTSCIRRKAADLVHVTNYGLVVKVSLTPNCQYLYTEHRFTRRWSDQLLGMKGTKWSNLPPGFGGNVFANVRV